MSSHSRLVHVAMSVNFVSTDEITSLVVNSAGLLTLHIFLGKCNADDWSRSFLPKKIFHVKIEHDFYHLRSCELIRGTELSPLWPLCDTD